MGFLKSFGTFILSFLLFLSLSVFSFAFLLNSTVLNQDFVTRHIDRLDISELSREIAEEQIAGELPVELAFLEDAIFNLIDEQEPWVKEQLDAAIDSGYDFFLDRTDTLRITIPLESRKQILKDTLWRELNRQLEENPELILGLLKPFVEDNVQQVSQAIPELALVPRAQLSEFLDSFIVEIAAQIKREGIPPEIDFVVEDIARPYFERYYDSFAARIPDELVLDEADIPADAMDQILQVKKYIGWFRAGFYWMIVFMALLIAGIYLIHRNIQDPSRAIGIDLLTFGVLDIIGTLLARSYIPFDSLVADIPVSLETWLTGIYNDIFSVMLTFSIVVAAIGVALIVVSFVFRKKVVG
jgi:hypothetical protein